MKLLREIIRKILAESMKNEDKIIELMLRDGPSLKQAVSLAEGLGIIRQYEGKPITTDLRREVLAVFVCSLDFFEALKEAGGYGFSPVTSLQSDNEIAVAMRAPNAM